MTDKKKDPVEEALRIAVQIICFDDAADYGEALWEIVECLGGAEAVELLEEDPDSAYEKYCE